jgi:hypothetical protein
MCRFCLGVCLFFELDKRHAFAIVMAVSAIPLGPGELVHFGQACQRTGGFPFCKKFYVQNVTQPTDRVMRKRFASSCKIFQDLEFKEERPGF